MKRRPDETRAAESFRGHAQARHLPEGPGATARQPGGAAQTNHSPAPPLGPRLLAYVIALALAAGVAWLLWRHPWQTLLIVVLAPLSCLPLLVGLFPGVWTRRTDAPPPARTDLVRRRRVWRVLSELYLDTELDDDDNERIAAVLADSGYSTGQLEEILYRELHPVLHNNLLCVAGEWAGFDLDELEKPLLRRSPRRSGLAVIPGKWMVRSGWAAIEAQVRRAVR